MKTERSRAGIVLIIIGIVCCLGAAALAIYNYSDAERAGRASEEILGQLIDAIQNPAEDYTPGKRVEDLLPEEDIPEMDTVTIDGNEYIGMIAFPSLDNLELPVMKDWDYDRLSISPCRYTGSYYTDDLVICGHNYSRHFEPLLNDLKLGEDVYFLTVGGEKIHYVTVNKEVVEPTDIEVMIANSRNREDSENQWDLTLFTCHYGGQTRCAIRCARVTDKTAAETSGTGRR